MQKLFGMMLLIVGASAFATGAVSVVPEIGVGSAGSAVALLSGTLLVIRGRRKR
jgi:membrane protein implicated in regulation of membrane protease activity